MAKEKTGGRKAGTPNKPKPMRTRITNFLDDNFEGVENDFKTLDALQKITFFEKLIRYSVPSLKSIEILEDEQKDSIRYDLLDKDELLFLSNLGKKYNFQTKNNMNASRFSDTDLKTITDIITSYE